MKAERTNSKTIQVQQVSLIEDLRAAPLWVRFLCSIGLAALLAYFAFFGPLAVVGIWRANLLSLSQLSMFCFALAIQSLIAWAVKIKPALGGALFGVVWLIPIGILVLQLSGPSKAAQMPILLSLPLAISVLNGAFAQFFGSKLAVPIFRGEPV